VTSSLPPLLLPSSLGGVASGISPELSLPPLSPSSVGGVASGISPESSLPPLSLGGVTSSLPPSSVGGVASGMSPELSLPPSSAAGASSTPGVSSLEVPSLPGIVPSPSAEFELSLPFTEGFSDVLASSEGTALPTSDWSTPCS